MLRFTPELLNKRHWSGPGLLAFLTAFLTGCANTCFVAVSNPPTGTIGVVTGNPPPACTLAKAKGAVRVVTHVNRLCEFCSESNRIQSVFLSLKGIDIHPKANAWDESSDWQELFPQLEKQPLQVDLLNESANSPRAKSITEKLLIPAGTYDLVRLRITSNQRGADDEIPAKNACGSVGPHCVVMADGQIEPLVFVTDTIEFRFASETREDGLFFVLPGSDSELLIELTPIASISTSFGRGVRSFSLVLSRTRAERETVSWLSGNLLGRYATYACLFNDEFIERWRPLCMFERCANVNVVVGEGSGFLRRTAGFTAGDYQVPMRSVSPDVNRTPSEAWI